jgi:hypothetical protein
MNYTTASYTFSFHTASGSESKLVFGIEMRVIFLSCYMKPFHIMGVNVCSSQQGKVR